MKMDWLLILEIALVAVLCGFYVYRIIATIKESKLLPIILEAIMDAEDQEGLKGEDKLNHALDYIKREATTNGIAIDIGRTIKLIEKLVTLTKKVNFK